MGKISGYVCASTCLLNLDLKLLREIAETTDSGRLFHTSTIRFENTFARTSSLGRLLNSIHGWPRVSVYCTNVKNLSMFTTSILFIILNISIITTALNLLYSRDGKPSSFSLLWYDSPESALTKR